MKMKELAQRIEKELGKTLINLYERWQDEKEFEDFNEYIEAFKKLVPETYAGSRRPFGFKVHASDGDMHIIVKEQGRYLVVEYKKI